MADTQKIFLIEDDPDQILMYTVAFEKRGFQVVSTSQGSTAAEQAQEMRPDIILLDISMEDKNGMDILRDIKERKETKDIPVIVFTNFSKQHFEDAAKKLGADKFIVKTDRLPREIAEDITSLLQEQDRD